VFLHYFVELDHSADDVVEALTSAPHEWLSDLAQDSVSAGARLSADVGLNLGPRRIHRPVDVLLGAPIRLSGATVLPVTWVAHTRACLFPRLEADLEVAPMGARRSQLAINVRYQPPLGTVGVVADRALLHRVAEATIKDFMDRAAQRLHRHIALNAGSSRLSA